MPLEDFLDVSKDFTLHPEKKMGNNLHFDLPLGSKDLPTDTYLFRHIRGGGMWYLVKLNPMGYKYIDPKKGRKPFDYIGWQPPTFLPESLLPGNPIGYVTRKLNTLLDRTPTREGRGGYGRRLEPPALNEGDYYNFYMNGWDIWRIEQDLNPTPTFINWYNENPLEGK